MSGFFKFWWDCIVHGAHLGEGAFGIAEIAAAFLWLFYRKKGQEEAAKASEERVKKWAKICFLILFTFTTLLYAPYAKYKEARSHATDETTHDIPYDGLIKQLDQVNLEKEIQRKRADAEHERAEHNAELVIQAYSSTNAPSDEQSLKAVIEDTTQQLASISIPTNGVAIRDYIKNKTRLEKDLFSAQSAETRQREMLERKAFIAPLYIIWQAAMDRLAHLLQNSAKSCDGTFGLAKLPALDELWPDSFQFHDILSVGTNCPWSMLYCSP